MALDTGATGVVALSVLVIASLDVTAAVALYPLLIPAGMLLTQVVTAMRIAYGAVFAVAAASLLGTPNTERFEAVWDAGLLLFGVCLVLVGIAAVRAPSIPAWIGVLVVIPGIGYVVDTLLAALASTTVSVGGFTFVGDLPDVQYERGRGLQHAWLRLCGVVSLGLRDASRPSCKSACQSAAVRRARDSHNYVSKICA